MNIDVVPLRTTFNDVSYDPLNDENFEKFYELLANSKEIPTTSQPTPGAYLEVFERAKRKKESIIVIALSSGLSGTYQSACIAAEMADYDDIRVVDSLQAIMGQRMIVEHAVKMRDEGADVEEIVAFVEDARHRTYVYGALDTLKYLRKGGRISMSTELIGAMLAIKPIVTLDEKGAIAMCAKARGHAGAVTAMVKLVDEHPHFDPSVPVYFGYSLDAEPANKFRKLMTTRCHLKETRMAPVGSVIGTHVGAGAFAIAYLAAKEEDAED